MSPDENRRTWWLRNCGWAVLVMVGFWSATALAFGEDAKLAEIRENAVSSVRLIQSLEYSFRIEGSDGWKAKAAFHSEGRRFRVDRKDVAGSTVLGKRTEPATWIAAFDGKRQQLYCSHDSILRLKDGSDGATYATETPQTMVYSWLRASGAEHHWELVRTQRCWSKRCADARHAGTFTIGDEKLEAVDFPQKANVPCTFRVYFAPRLGYLPIKYTRTVDKTQAVASSMTVQRYKLIRIDEKLVALPLEVRFEQNGKDGVSLPMSMTFTVDENSLKTNHEIDGRLFTIDPRLAKTVYDVDVVNRHIQEVEKAAEAARIAPKPASN